MGDSRPDIRVASLIGAAALIASACTHAPTAKPSLAMVGVDGSWAGYVQGCELQLKTASTPLHLIDPQVLAVGSSILLNSGTHDARYSYVSLDTEQVACRAGGVDYEQVTKGCLASGSFEGTKMACLVRLDGCAARVDGATLRRFARAQGLPRPDARVRGPGGDLDACRPGWRKGTRFERGVDDEPSAPRPSSAPPAHPPPAVR